MHLLAHGDARPATSPWLRPGRLAILLLPITLLAIAAARSAGEKKLLMGFGALFQCLACVLVFRARQGFWQPMTPAVAMLYVIALSWILLGGFEANDWFFHVAQAVLLV